MLGGTFDPIHYGHLRPALDVFQALPMQEIRFVPLNVAVHRPQPLASAAQRLEMVRRAVAGQDGFRADDRELVRAGGSYSYDTLVSLRDELGSEPPICLLTGFDAYRNFLGWRRPDGILELAHLVVMQRPGGDKRQNDALRRWSEPRLCAEPAELAKWPGGRILFQGVTQLDISATGIRDLVARGLSPRFLLPDAVLDLIEGDNPYLIRPGA